MARPRKAGVIDPRGNELLVVKKLEGEK